MPLTKLDTTVEFKSLTSTAFRTAAIVALPYGPAHGDGNTATGVGSLSSGRDELCLQFVPT